MYNYGPWNPDFTSIKVDVISSIPLRWVPGQARVLPEDTEPRMSSENLKNDPMKGKYIQSSPSHPLISICIEIFCEGKNCSMQWKYLTGLLLFALF
jgi:hypothetical protein